MEHDNDAHSTQEDTIADTNSEINRAAVDPEKVGQLRERASTQTHLQILQGIIGRMASGSANAKTWATTLVSAILVLAIDKARPLVVVAACGPVLVFAFIDAYYLRMEQYFRGRYDKIVEQINIGQYEPIRPFEITKPPDTTVAYLFDRVLTSSIWPFYLLLLAAVAFCGACLYF